MTNATLVYRGREYVLVPRKHFERLTAAQEDRRDAAKVRRAAALYRAGKLQTISHAALARKLGV